MLKASENLLKDWNTVRAIVTIIYLYLALCFLNQFHKTFFPPAHAGRREEEKKRRIEEEKKRRREEEKKGRREEEKKKKYKT